MIKAVVLDAMGVIYETADDVVDLLIPFARSRGSELPDVAITDLYVECSLGRMSSADLWTRLWISEDGDALDREYLSGHRLQVGIWQFLAQLRELKIACHCISNDVSEWSRELRRRHRLEGSIEHWVISGDVGIRKPDRGIFGAFVDRAGLDPAECLFIDDRLKNVEAARKLGFDVAWFGDSARETAISVLPRVRSLAEVVRLVGRSQRVR